MQDGSQDQKAVSKGKPQARTFAELEILVRMEKIPKTSKESPKTQGIATIHILKYF